MEMLQDKIRHQQEMGMSVTVLLIGPPGRVFVRMDFEFRRFRSALGSIDRKTGQRQ